MGGKSVLKVPYAMARDMDEDIKEKFRKEGYQFQTKEEAKEQVKVEIEKHKTIGEYIENSVSKAVDIYSLKASKEKLKELQKLTRASFLELNVRKMLGKINRNENISHETMYKVTCDTLDLTKEQLKNIKTAKKQVKLLTGEVEPDKVDEINNQTVMIEAFGTGIIHYFESYFNSIILGESPDLNRISAFNETKKIGRKILEKQGRKQSTISAMKNWM